MKKSVKIYQQITFAGGILVQLSHVHGFNEDTGISDNSIHRRLKQQSSRPSFFSLLDDA
jgi:hypothetical protein